MPNVNSIESAERILRNLISAETTGQGWPFPEDAIRAFRGFGQVNFDVPGAPEVDGFLFEYGTFNFTGHRAFVVSLVRQLERCDESGEHDSYSQVGCEFTYEADSQLESRGSRVSWWFPGAAETFDSWISAVTADEVWSVVRDKQPLSFEVSQETI